MSLFKEFSKGLYEQNPVFRLALGLCPTLAVSNSIENAIGMGLAATFVLVCSNVIVSLIRKGVPQKIRIPIYIVVIATFVTIVDLSLAAMKPDLHKSLGLFIPLIVVNCIILGRNAVAVDAVSVAVMGMSPDEVEHIKLGEEFGVGPADLSKINVIGNKIADVKVKFEKPPTEDDLFEEALNLLEVPSDLIDGKHGNVCSTCMLNYLGPIWALRDDAGKTYRQNIYLLSGSAELPAKCDRQLLLWGNCQKQNYQKCKETAIFVGGCPPTQLNGYMALGKALYTKKKFYIGLLKRLVKGMSKIGKLGHWPD